MRSIAIVLPVFNDWQSAVQVAAELRSELNQNAPAVEVALFVVDDGSTEMARPEDLSAFRESKVVLVHLPGNVGHQRAVVAGIRRAVEGNPDYVLVMDADGEDRPDAVVSLIDRARHLPESVVVAKRGARFESAAFRTLYIAHKLLFRMLVGQSLDFGNFVLLPRSAAKRISQMPEASSHLASAILKSRLSIQRVTVDRGHRHFGESKMNMEQLISHSFSSLSIFTERIMVRLVIFSFFATLVSALAAAVVIAVRFFSDSATPGWATAALGLLIVFSLQFLSFAGLGTLITLNVATLRDHLKGSHPGPKATGDMPHGETSGSRRGERALQDAEE